MYGVENRFKMQLLLGLKGSPLVGVGITNFVTPEVALLADLVPHRAEKPRWSLVAGIARRSDT